MKSTQLSKTFVFIILFCNFISLNAQNLTWQFAIETADLELIKHFISESEDINKIIDQQSGWSALHILAKNNKHFIADYLISKSANIDNQSKDGATPLMIAAELGHIDFVKLLLNNGAKINVQDDKGDTALTRAIKRTSIDCAGFLTRQSNVDICIKNNDDLNAPELIMKNSKSLYGIQTHLLEYMLLNNKDYCINNTDATDAYSMYLIIKDGDFIQLRNILLENEFFIHPQIIASSRAGDGFKYYFKENPFAKKQKQLAKTKNENFYQLASEKAKEINYTFAEFLGKMDKSWMEFRSCKDPESKGYHNVCSIDQNGREISRLRFTSSLGYGKAFSSQFNYQLSKNLNNLYFD